MATSIRPKSNLNRQDWLVTALEVLTEQGIAAVTVDRLSTTLNVTRGSFYHHFKDRAELLDSLLQHWSTHLTTRIRDQVAGLQLDPSTTLLVLLRTIRNERAALYDAPFRAWALHDERAREVVSRVDEERLAFIRSQFEGLGFEGTELESRARLFLYYEMAAPAMLFRDSSVDSEALLLERHRMLTTRCKDANMEP
jgi:AcrR family transcriptional regulator